MNPRTPELIALCPRDEDGEGQPAPRHAADRTISASYQTHGEARGFRHLRVTKAADGGIVLDPRVADYCVMGWEGSR
jgi:hypothetical protein